MSGNFFPLTNTTPHKRVPVHVTQGIRRARVLVVMETMVRALSGQTSEFNLILHTTSLSFGPDNGKGGEFKKKVFRSVKT